MHRGYRQSPQQQLPERFSVLMLGLDLEAKSLARHCEQHTFVCAAGDGVPELVKPKFDSTSDSASYTITA